MMQLLSRSPSAPRRPPWPPGPRGLELLRLVPRVRRDPLAVMRGLAARYGDVIRVGRGLFYLVWQPRDVERVLVTNASNYRKGESVAPARGVFGNGLVLADGAEWERHRRLMAPAFARSRAAALAERLVAGADDMVAAWRARRDPTSPVNVSAAVLGMLQRTMLRTLLGVDVGARAGELAAAQELVERLIDRRAWNPIRWTERLPTPFHREARRALATVEEVVRGAIRARRTDPSRGDDAVSLLIGAAGDEFSDDQLRDEMMTLIFTGHGTAAHAIGWALHLLATHPEVEERVRSEAEASPLEAGRVTDGAGRLVSTRRVFDEALRLYPPAWILARTAIDADTLGGYDVPAGMVVLLGTYVTHHAATIWDEPERFDPDRFLPECARERPAFAFYPFGGGRRQCIGTEFAYLMATIVIATVVRSLRLAPVPGREPTPTTATILRARGGVWLQLTPR